MRTFTPVQRILLCAALIFSSMEVQVGYATPLKIHPDNPRYFQDSTGKALYFAGSSTWFVLQENGHRADKKRITEFLDWLEAWGHNYTRVWSYFFYMNNNKGPQKPWPYMRTGPGLANDGASEIRSEKDECAICRYGQIFSRGSREAEHFLFHYAVWQWK